VSSIVVSYTVTSGPGRIALRRRVVSVADRAFRWPTVIASAERGSVPDRAPTVSDR
jgi:hypothetical protein